MAKKRMFSKDITNSSNFLMMSQSAQNLYFHIGMNADDDGFCEIFTIVRMTESKPDDIRALHERGFIVIINTKVCIVKDWHTNNNIQADRYKRSEYLNGENFVKIDSNEQEMNKIVNKDEHFLNKNFREIYKYVMAEKIANISRYKDIMNTMDTECIQNVSKMDTQVSIEYRDRVDTNVDANAKKNINLSRPIFSFRKKDFDIFWNAYPRKIGKKKVMAVFLKIKNVKIEEMVNAIEAQKKTKQWQDPQYIPLPLTWLNQGRWEDEAYVLTPEQECRALIAAKGENDAYFAWTSICRRKQLDFDSFAYLFPNI